MARKSQPTTIDIPLAGESPLPATATADLATIEADPKVAPIVTKAHELLEFAKNLQVTNQHTAQQAVEVLAAAKRAKTTMETARKMFVGPLDKHVKSINGWFKSKLAPVTEADAITRKKLGEYQAQQEKIAPEEAERQRKEQEEAYRKQLAEAKERGESPAPVAIIEEESSPRAATFSTHGMAKTRSLGWTYEVTSLEQLDPAFKMEVPNDSLIKEAIEAGAREIPGLRIFEKTTIAVY